MGPIRLRIVFTGLCLLFVFLSGYWLRHTGKPYSAIFFNIHKLIALAAIVFLAMIIFKVHQVSPLSGISIVFISITTLFFIVTIVTGGLLSVAGKMPILILKLHQIFPYLTVISVVATIYFLLTRKF